MTNSPSKQFALLAAFFGIVGSITLIGSFMINPGPPPGLSPEALVAWAAPREGLILLGGWTQGIGSLLTVLFALALVHAGGDASGFAGTVTKLASATILAVSLIEVTFYLAGAQALATGDKALGLTSTELIKAVQHVFLIAPAVLIPLGFVLVRTRVLGPAFAYSAIAIGVTLQVLGAAGLFRPLQNVVDRVLIVQGLWFVSASIAFVFRQRSREHG